MLFSQMELQGAVTNPLCDARSRNTSADRYFFPERSSAMSWLSRHGRSARRRLRRKGRCPGTVLPAQVSGQSYRTNPGGNVAIRSGPEHTALPRPARSSSRLTRGPIVTHLLTKSPSWTESQRVLGHFRSDRALLVLCRHSRRNSQVESERRGPNLALSQILVQKAETTTSFRSHR
jgi:hypothetical protein